MSVATPCPKVSEATTNCSTIASSHVNVSVCPSRKRSGRSTVILSCPTRFRLAGVGETDGVGDAEGVGVGVGEVEGVGVGDPAGRGVGDGRRMFVLALVLALVLVLVVVLVFSPPVPRVMLSGLTAPLAEWLAPSGRCT